MVDNGNIMIRRWAPSWRVTDATTEAGTSAQTFTTRGKAGTMEARARRSRGRSQLGGRSWRQELGGRS